MTSVFKIIMRDTLMVVKVDDGPMGSIAETVVGKFDSLSAAKDYIKRNSSNELPAGDLSTHGATPKEKSREEIIRNLQQNWTTSMRPAPHLNLRSAEQICQDIKKYLDEGWSMSISKRKAGLRHPKSKWVLTTPEFISLNESHKRKVLETKKFDFAWRSNLASNDSEQNK